MKQKLALPGRSGRWDSAGVRIPPGREQRTCQPRGNWNILEIAEGGVALHIVLLLDSFKFRGVDVHPGQYLGARDSKHVYHLPKLLPVSYVAPPVQLGDPASLSLPGGKYYPSTNQVLWKKRKSSSQLSTMFRYGYSVATPGHCLLFWALSKPGGVTVLLGTVLISSWTPPGLCLV